MATTDPVKSAAASGSQASNPVTAQSKTQSTTQSKSNSKGKNGQAEQARVEQARATAAEAAAARGDAAGDDEEYEEYAPLGRSFLIFTAVPSWMISLVFHMVVLFLLALITIPEPNKTRTELTVHSPDPVPDEVEEFELDDIAPVPEMELSSTLGPNDTIAAATMDVEVPDMQFTTDLDAAPVQIDLSEFAERTAPKNVLTKKIGTSTGTGLVGRGAAMKGELLKAAGGEGTEAAVANALKWFAHHQLPDGGWSFDHTIGPGVRTSPNPGFLVEARNGATAMALLPFLGAGQTHLEGEYKEVVGKGLLYLLNHQKANGSFHEEGGRMYSHGLASIVLCEAYAMTQDPKLAQPAQGAVNFIVYAQDPVNGGWRYDPRAGGDTSVVGWQLMALKSGSMGYLQVPSTAGIGASRFLDAVQTEGGAKYGYVEPGAGTATTSVGLLCRMYLGWKHDNDGLKRGVEYLAQVGPSTTDMYYNYYATQVMRHYGGEHWTEWNKVMRGFLLETQSKDGPAAGSWFIPGDHGSTHGGRVYSTSLATLILEVYYRHLPIYGQKAADDEFPL